jgi:hypothetical protein
MLLGPDDSYAVIELLALGFTRADLTTWMRERRPKSLLMMPSPAEIFWDVTDMLCEGKANPMDVRWLKKMITATTEAGLPPRFAVFDGDECLLVPDTTAQSLIAGESALLASQIVTWDRDDAQGGRLLLLDPKPDDPFELARRARKLAIERDLQLVLLFPTIMMIAHPEWFTPVEVAAARRRMQALLPIVTQVIVTFEGESELLREFCRATGIITPAIQVLEPEPMKLSPASATLPTADDSVWTVLLPRDYSEQLQLLAMWRLVRHRPATVVLVPPAASPRGTQAELHAAMSSPETTVSLLPTSPQAIQEHLTITQRLLAPHSREDSDVWIEATLSNGGAVLAAASPTIFHKWNSHINYYVDWRNEVAFARRWEEFTTAGRKSWEAALSSWSENLIIKLRSAPKLTPISTFQATVGRFHYLGDTGSCTDAEGLIDGRNALYGSGWSRIIPEGVRVLSCRATLRYSLEQLPGEDHRGALLVRNLGTKPIELVLEINEIPAARTTVPPKRWRWMNYKLAHRSGNFVHDIRMTLRTSSVNQSDLYAVGFIVFPEDEDWHWFNLMDDVSQARHPTLGRITV